MIAIRLTKLSGRRGATIPVGSTVTGLATAWPEPEIGVPYLLRHGPLSASWLDQCDWFYTTTVLKIRRYKDHRILTTKNSRWRLELGILPDDTPDEIIAEAIRRDAELESGRVQPLSEEQF